MRTFLTHRIQNVEVTGLMERFYSLHFAQITINPVNFHFSIIGHLSYAFYSKTA